MTIDYRVVDDIDGLNRIVDLEVEIWGLEWRDAVPANIMRAITNNGGVAIGAYDADSMIGMAFAFPAFRENQPILWSHMTAVLPAYQGRGIGAAIKHTQRLWAQVHGYTQLRWTFDPIQRGNAHFNLTELGAVAVNYHVNFYGVMNDAINQGMPSDRLETRWNIQQAAADATNDFQLSTSLLTSQESHPVSSFPDTSPDNVTITIPRSIRGFSHQALLDWRFALRAAFQWAFEHDYQAHSFYDDADKGVYLLSRIR